MGRSKPIFIVCTEKRQTYFPIPVQCSRFVGKFLDPMQIHRFFVALVCYITYEAQLMEIRRIE